MSKIQNDKKINSPGRKIVPVNEAVGMVIAHDITEIIPGKFKGRAFKKGYIVRQEDISHLQRLGKENLFVLEIKEDEMHENAAVYAIAGALAGSGIRMEGEPREGKINLIAERDGLLKVDRDTLFKFNMLGEVICATVHNNSVVKKGQVVAGTRAIPLVVKKSLVEDAVKIAGGTDGILSVKEIRRPRAGIVITGNEVYHGKIEDAFSAVITKKVMNMNGEIIGVYFAPDNAEFIRDRIRELIAAGADLIITTGGMSVDPDDVTRFAIKNTTGVKELTYGSPVLPGAMFLVAYIDKKLHNHSSALPPQGEGSISKVDSKLIPILGIPACGMYSNITILDLILPRVLAGERIGRKELAELGHGGLCLKCKKCRYPICPFGK